MISTKDAVRFARIKFAARKARNIFSGCTVALGIIVILTGLIASSGLVSIAKTALTDQFSDHFYVMDRLNCSVSNNVTDCGNGISDQQSFINANAQYTFKSIVMSAENISQSFQLEDFNSDIQQTLTNSSANQPTVQMTNGALDTIDPKLLSDYMFKGYSMNDDYQGKIPVVISEQMLAGQYFEGSSKSQKDLFDIVQRIVTSVKGKTYKLSYDTGSIQPNQQASQTISSHKITNVEFIVVGMFSPSFGSAGFDANMYIPAWSLTKNQELADLFKDTPNNIVYAEFNTKTERDQFVTDQYSKSISYGLVYPITSKFEMFASLLDVLRVVVLIVGGVIFIIAAFFMMSTIGKVVSDSRKEIALFRAFGALKGDIRKIFFSYTLLLTNTGFLLGLIISVIICLLLSLAYGQEFYYSIMNLGVNYDVPKPLFMFIGTPFLEILIVYIGINFLGILASLYPVIRASNVDPINALRDE